MALKHYEGIREFRILLNFEESIRKICKIAISHKDISIFLIPYGKSGIYYYGEGLISQGNTETTFHYDTQFKTSDIPKLSIHQSGQIHIYYQNPKEKAGPLFTIPLMKFRGEHLATVTVDNFYVLPTTDTIKNKSGIHNCICELTNKDLSFRIIIYLNGYEPRFIYNCNLIYPIKLKDNNKSNYSYLGMAIVPQPQLNFSKSKGGVTVISGWNPRTPHNKPLPFLYLRAE